MISVVKSGSELKAMVGGLAIAGSKHVYNVALQNGLEAVNPEEHLDEGGKIAIAEKVGAIMGKLEVCFAEASLCEPAQEALCGLALKLSFRQLALEHVCNSLDIIPTTDYEGLDGFDLPSKSAMVSSAVASKFGRFVERKLLSRQNFFLDFSSQSAKKLSGKSEILPLRPLLPKPGQSGINIRSQNLIQHFKRLRSGQRIRLIIPLSGQELEPMLNWQQVQRALSDVVSPSVSHGILTGLIDGYSEFETSKHALAGFLANCEKKPEYAYFNNFGSMELSGFGSAAHEAGLPVRFASHGAMISYGEPNRKLITSILSRAVFNEPACATQLFARSELQVSRKSNLSKLKPEIRVMEVSGSINSRRGTDRPFRVYLAPNFLSWFANFHGITHSCFEAEYCIRKLVCAIASSNDLVVDLRLKTTAGDVARQKIKEPDRGLLPSDITDLIDETNGIFDASYGSHSAYMESADLVITEGVTAVTFEALEMRKPLLFINQYSSREPALPATKTTGHGEVQRSATYCCSADDDLKRILLDLRRLHAGKPLTNDELSNLIWV